jgi:hemolysin activation/secretion protein
LTKWDTTLSFDVERSESVVVAEPFSQLDIKSETTSYSATLRHPFYKTLSKEFAMDLQLEKSESKTSLLDQDFPFKGSLDAKNKITALRFSQDWVNRSISQVFAMRSSFSFGLDMWDATILDTEPDGEFFSWIGQFQWLSRISPLNSQVLLRGILRLSNDPVLPAEKFAIGGSATVRGYRENQMTTDNGVIGSLEWRVPVFQLKIPGLSKGEQDGEIQLCPFFDVGKGWNTDSEDPSPSDIYSLGAGARWLVSKKIYAEICWGYALRDVEDPGEYDLQDDGVHFEISAEF